MKLSLLLPLVVAATIPAQAAVLHDNGTPLAIADRSDTDLFSQRGDQFTVTSPEMLQGAQWWGLYAFNGTPQAVDSFVARIYAVIADTPATTPLFEFSLSGVSREATAGTISGLTIYRYDTVLPDTILGPGTYVFSLMNNTNADTNDSWFWPAGSVTGGTAYERFALTDPWSPYRPDGESPVPTHAFNLSGVLIPEPGTMSLLGLAAIGLAAIRRRAGRGEAART